MAVGPDREDRIAAVEGIRLGAVESHIRYAKRLDLVWLKLLRVLPRLVSLLRMHSAQRQFELRKNMLRQLQVAIF